MIGSGPSEDECESEVEMGLEDGEGAKQIEANMNEGEKVYLKKFLKILPGDSLLSIVEGLDGLVGVAGCCATSSFSSVGAAAASAA
jgi:hypothetical protein